MSVLTAFTMMGLVLLGIVLLCFGATWLEKQKHGDDFDERQQLVRGKGYQLAFEAGFPCFLAAIAVTINQVEGEKTVEPYLLILFTYAIQSTIFHVYCMINHASLPVSQKPFINFLGFVIMGSLMLYSFCDSQRDCPLSLTGYGSWGWAQLVGSVYTFAMAMMYLIQMLRREKE